MRKSLILVNQRHHLISYHHTSTASTVGSQLSKSRLSKLSIILASPCFWQQREKEVLVIGVLLQEKAMFGSKLNVYLITIILIIYSLCDCIVDVIIGLVNYCVHAYLVAIVEKYGYRACNLYLITSGKGLNKQSACMKDFPRSYNTFFSQYEI